MGWLRIVPEEVEEEEVREKDVWAIVLSLVTPRFGWMDDFNENQNVDMGCTNTMPKPKMDATRTMCT